MKILSGNKAILSLLTGVLLMTSCSEKNDPIITEPIAPQVIKGDLTTNKTLTADRVWILEGNVRVLEGATLTIEAGTVIKGDKASKAALIIERGGKINAAGTAAKPIVFTSNQTAGARQIGDWAGVIVCGKAKVNVAGGTSQYEGGILGTETAKYGGTDDADNSGVIRYVRIEYAGIAIQQDKEINSLTLCGVGSGTTVENIQVSYGGDDAFEFFGGTVNCKNLIAYRTTDDDFDFDFGYRGSIQFAVSIKDPNIFDASASGASNGIECDNGTAATDVPVTRPVLSNFTFIGPGANANAKHNSGNVWRKFTQFVLRNSIIVDSRVAGIEVATAETGSSLTAGTSEFSYNLVHGNTSVYKMSSSAFVDLAALETYATAKSNTKLTAAADAKLTSTSLDAPNLTLKADSPAKTGANFTGLTGFQTVAFRGAFDTTDWTAGWANFNPQTAVY